MYRKILIFLICTCFSSSLMAQGQDRGVFLLNNEDNILIHVFNFDESKILWSKIFIDGNKVNVPYCLKGASNVIHNFHSDLSFRKWNKSSKKISYDHNSKYVSSVFPTINGVNTFPVYLFYGDSVLNYSYLEGSKADWITNKKLIVPLTSKNSIIGVIGSSDDKVNVLLNCEDQEGVNFIIKVHSTDNGHNWIMSSVAVKHNQKELKGWCVAAHNDNPKSVYMMLTDKSNAPYYSHSKDGGSTWSYPKLISSNLSGENYKMTIDRGQVAIFYNKIDNQNPSENGNMMLWSGSVAEFVSEPRMGHTMKIAYNLPNSTNKIFSIEDVAYYNKRHYFVLLRNNVDNKTSLQIRLIRRTKEKHEKNINLN